jgi:SMI1/KNR4 family protein SUKH-1
VGQQASVIQVILTSLLAVAILVVSGVIVCLVIDGIHTGLSALHARLQPQPRETREEYRARLRNPQFDVLEVHFGAPVPESLTRLYRNTHLVQQEDIELVDPEDQDSEAGASISQFLPADAKALEEIGRYLGRPFFPFAKDVFGNCYFVRIEAGVGDLCPVYFWDHEGSASAGETKVAASLDEFVARPRRGAT